MYYEMKRTYESLKDKSGLEKEKIDFRGFDGNTEGGHMLYARFICRASDGRFQNLAKDNDLNSHDQLLTRYRRMLKEFKKSDNRHTLTKDDLVRITSKS